MESSYEAQAEKVLEEAAKEESPDLVKEATEAGVTGQASAAALAKQTSKGWPREFTLFPVDFGTTFFSSILELITDKMPKILPTDKSSKILPTDKSPKILPTDKLSKILPTDKSPKILPTDKSPKILPTVKMQNFFFRTDGSNGPA
jgi:hypothetical protein